MTGPRAAGSAPGGFARRQAAVLLSIAATALLALAPAEAHGQGVAPDPLCAAASDQGASWFPVGARIRWREYSDRPGVWGCYGRVYDRGEGGYDTGRELAISFDLIGGRGVAQTLVITAENTVSNWFDPARKLIPFVRAVFAAAGRGAPNQLVTCFEVRCSGDVPTPLGPATLSYRTGPPRPGDGRQLNPLEYRATIDLTGPANWVPPPPPPPPPPPESVWRVAVRTCLAGGDDLDAIIDACFRAIVGMELRDDAEVSEVFAHRGFAYIRKGNHDRAIQDFDKALEFNARNHAALNSRGVAWARKGDPRRALADYDAAFRLSPTTALYVRNRGLARLDLEDWAAAVRDLDEALRLQPDHPAALNGRGLANRRRGRYRESLPDFTRAIALDPKSHVYVSNRGIAYLLLDDHGRARADLDASLALRPDYAVALYARGVLRRRAGDRAGGDADVAQAVRLQADIAEFMARRGVR